MKEPFNTKVSLFKSLFETKDVPFDLTITDVYSRIKRGNDALIEKINMIRNSTDKDQVAEIKKTLVAIMFNGTFTERNDLSLVEHSGCCVLDYDKYPTLDDMEDERKKLMADPFTLMLFTSPSGNGLKQIIRVPKSTKEEHKRRFSAYGAYIKSKFFDTKNCNVSRVCFESYDPDVYINQDCEIFSEIEPEVGYHVADKVVLIPLENESEITDRLVKWWDNKFGFHEGSRNSNLYILAENLNEYGVSKDYAYGYISNNIVIGDFSDHELRNVIDSGYSRTTPNTKYFEDRKRETIIREKIKSGTPISEIAKQTGVREETILDFKKVDDNIEPFWIIKKDKKGAETIEVEPYKYAQFLMKNGFKKYFPEQAEMPTFVHIRENKVKLCSTVAIKDMVLSFLLKNGLINVWNFCSKSTMLFNENHLNMLDSISLEMIKDTKHTAYIPFLNGLCKVTKAKVEMVDYIDAEGYIWENQIIPRVFIPSSDHKNDFQDLISKVSNSDPERISSLERTIGYLIHSYKDKSNQLSVIINDQEINDNPNGRSGKSLLITALTHFKRVVKIDGKTFDPKKSDFTYQRVNLDTQILAFDDVKKNFDFETLFSLITEGITVNRKNKDEVFIPFERSPKIMITTNYVINGSGASHDGRRHEIEFYQYFNGKVTPLKEYGRLLFDSWAADDWVKFDNYMISTLQNFLANGLTTVTSINAEAKRFIQSTSKDFYDWCIEDDNIGKGTKVYNTECFDAFVKEYKSYKMMHNRTFVKWIAEYASFIGLEMQKKKGFKGRYFIIGQELNPIEITSDKADHVPF
ncbi:BT4734/BF3469 family protein [Pedobacter antarcticus]|uniref:BT4734/BF3469 family protein n=1 Tax=Pedobacter antarcticus TaxID=34086 RepID=UPI00292FB107|nr:BT4734/BF3469 family protein [Pedobacter antarcticus]